MFGATRGVPHQRRIVHHGETVYGRKIKVSVNRASRFIDR